MVDFDVLFVGVGVSVVIVDERLITIFSSLVLVEV